MSTRAEILSLLRRAPLTVAELARRLDVTRNAVIVPLRQLEADGLVEGQERRDKRVGKPAVEYRSVPGHEDETSLAYPTFAELLVEALPRHLSRDQIQEAMTRIGAKLATQLANGNQSEASFSERLKAATDFADKMGAETVVEATEAGAVVRSYSCPLGRAVRQEPCVCSVIAAFFTDATGRRVVEQCDRGETLVCKFVIED